MSPFSRAPPQERTWQAQPEDQQTNMEGPLLSSGVVNQRRGGLDEDGYQRRGDPFGDEIARGNIRSLRRGTLASQFTVMTFALYPGCGGGGGGGWSAVRAA